MSASVPLTSTSRICSTSATIDYVTAVLNRSRSSVPPSDFVPDWGDAPRDEKVYPRAVRTSLPRLGSSRPDVPLADGLWPRHEAVSDFSVDAVAEMLFETYGKTARRLEIHANTDLALLPRYDNARWGRGVASGGARYPVSIYWCVGGGARSVRPGIYHYAPRHHEMHRLMSGDPSAYLNRGRPGTTGEQWLILTVKFWQNAFKYGGFSYHAITMDIGTVLQSWSCWAAGHRLHLSVAPELDESAVAAMLGLDPMDEGVFAVVRLTASAPAVAEPLDGQRESLPAARALVRIGDQERSRRTRRFPLTDAVQAEMLASVVGPASSAATPTPPPDSAPRVALPPRTAMTSGLRASLRARRSSFGRFCASPLALETLHSVLASGEAAVARLETLTGSAQRPLGFAVFALNVNGLAVGAYRYLPEQESLALVAPGDVSSELQRHYFLPNYQVGSSAAVIVPISRPATAVRADGPHAYRRICRAAGAASQAIYLASAGLGIGCGAALGFDNLAYRTMLRLADDEFPLLMIMIGPERVDQAAYRYELA